MIGTETLNNLTQILHGIFGTNIAIKYCECCLSDSFQIEMTKMEEYQAYKARSIFQYRKDIVDAFEVSFENDTSTYEIVLYISNLYDFTRYIKDLNDRYGLNNGNYGTHIQIHHNSNYGTHAQIHLNDELQFTMTNDAWTNMINKIRKWNLVDPDYRKVFNNSILNDGFHIDKIYADKKKKTVAVKWTDGTVTKAKTTEDFDLETGVAMAVLKKVIISHHHLQKIIEKRTIFTNEVKKEK